MTEARKAQLEAKRLKHQRKAKEANLKLRDEKYRKGRVGSVKIDDSVSQRVRNFVAIVEKPFTSRDVAKGVWPQKEINGYDTTTVSNELLRLVKRGVVIRGENNAKDAKNSGQLIYFKR